MRQDEVMTMAVATIFAALRTRYIFQSDEKLLKQAIDFATLAHTGVKKELVRRTNEAAKLKFTPAPASVL